jgi:glutamyl-tRNA synthetase
MRMEDLDANRVRPELGDEILADLRWLGLDWDEGPDLGGDHGPYDQGSRLELYRGAFERLRAEGRVYPCFCSRKDIAAAASAPQAPGDEVLYPGTCASLGPDEARRRIDAGDRHAWRFRVDPEDVPQLDDLVRGRWTGRPSDRGDFVVHRSDGVPAYQLAVMVDDARMDITEVVRGDDLLPSTIRQLMLYRALDRKPPAFGHVPLLLGTDGVRLSKRHEGVTLHELREAGLDAERIVGHLAHLVGLRPGPEPVAASALVDGFSLERIRPAPDGIEVDTTGW